MLAEGLTDRLVEGEMSAFVKGGAVGGVAQGLPGVALTRGVAGREGSQLGQQRGAFPAFDGLAGAEQPGGVVV